jgi:preprotein translocase subunit YajC
MLAMLGTALIAQNEAPPANGGPGAPPFWANPIFMILLFGIFFLVVMLPAQRRQRREQQEMLASIKPGSKVILSSGIVGRVVKVKEGEDEITIQSDDAKLRVLRTTVAKLLGDDTPSDTKA